MRQGRALARHAGFSACALATTALFVLTGCGVSSTSSSKTVDGAAIAGVSDEDLKGTTITMARFFGDCQEKTEGVTDLSKANSECTAISILTNKFNAENKWGIKVERMGGASWHSYYDSLNAALASSDRPDVAIMHGSNLPDYAAKGLLMEVPDGVGIDLSGSTKPALDAVTYKDKKWGVPFDTHAIISHLNMDILSQAGLVGEDGTYKLPTSPDELLKHAKAVKEKTGKNYIDIALSKDPMGERLWMTLVQQQGSDIISADGTKANMNSPEAKTSLEFINTLVKDGYTTVNHDYDASVQAFLRGESAVMYNGVWSVNQFTAEAPFKYETSDALMLFKDKATWANSHVWTVPVSAKPDAKKYRAAFEFTKFLNEHTGDWAIATGHMPATQKALDSSEYLNAPHRSQYLKTATTYARMAPRVEAWPKIADQIQEQIEATWLNGAGVEETLNSLQEAASSSLK